MLNPPGEFQFPSSMRTQVEKQKQKTINYIDILQAVSRELESQDFPKDIS